MGQVLSNVGWLIGDRAFRMCLGLVIGVWVARYLGPEQFGEYNYASAFVFLFGAIAAVGGMDGILVRELVRDDHLKHEILGTAFALRMIGSGFAFLVCVGAICYLRPQEITAQWLVGIAAAGMVLLSFDTVDVWFQGRVQSKYTVYAKNAGFISMSVLRVILILANAPLIAFAWAAFGEIAIGAVLLVGFYWTQGERIVCWQISLARARAILRLAWPLILSGLASGIYIKIDQVMLGNMVGSRAVAMYAAAVKITEVWNILPLAVMSSLYPLLVKLHGQSQELYRQRLRQIICLFFWSSCLISLCVALLSRSIVEVLFGDQYAEAAEVLSVHAYSGVLVSLGVVINYVVTLNGATIASLYGAVAGACANVLFNLWFIGSWGIVGAAVASLIGYGVAPLVQACLYDRKFVVLLVKAVWPFPGKASV